MAEDIICDVALLYFAAIFTRPRRLTLMKALGLTRRPIVTTDSRRIDQSNPIHGDDELDSSMLDILPRWQVELDVSASFSTRDICDRDLTSW